jgi:hypothetical protein
MGADGQLNYMKRVCKGWAVSAGKRQIQVPNPGKLDPSAGDNPNGSIAKAAKKLDELIRSTPGPKVVFGYSQGAQIAGTWLRKYAGKPDAPSPDELSFLLIGNPERRMGKQPWTKNTTPDTTHYKVRDVARKGDNWADYHGKPANRVLAMFGPIHTNYWGVDPYDPKAKVIGVTGNTEYVVVE